MSPMVTFYVSPLDSEQTRVLIVDILLRDLWNYVLRHAREPVAPHAYTVSKLTLHTKQDIMVSFHCANTSNLIATYNNDEPMRARSRQYQYFL